MKKAIVLALFASIILSCGNSKQAVNPTSPSTIATNPFGSTYSMPTFEPDTEEYFAATGTANGAKERIDVLQQAALTNAQNLIRQKMEHAYRGMVSDYSKYMGIDNSSSGVTNIERAGDQIIEAIVNDTQARAVEFSGVDEKGNVTCFVGIRISKKQLTDRIADKISKDQELKVRYDEEQFRKRMDDSFRNYKEK